MKHTVVHGQPSWMHYYCKCIHFYLDNYCYTSLLYQKSLHLSVVNWISNRLQLFLIVLMWHDCCSFNLLSVKLGVLLSVDWNWRVWLQSYGELCIRGSGLW